MCRHLAGGEKKELLKISILSKFRKEGEREGNKKPFSFKGSQMKHSSPFSLLSWLSGHPELMHLLSPGTEEEEVLMAKISIAAF